MLGIGMSTAASLRARARTRGLLPPAAAGLSGAAVGLLLALAQPAPVALGACALALVPLGAAVVAGPARAGALAGALAYGGTFVWGYTDYFSPLYAYQGLVDARPEPSAILVVIALAALPAAWMPLTAERASSLVLWPLYLVGYVPGIVVPLLVTGDLGRVLPQDLALLGALAITLLIVRLPPPPLELPRLAPRAFTWLLIALSLVSSAYIAVTFGVRSVPSLSDVYATRAAFDTALGGAAAAGYVVPWAANAINPLLMALGIARRRLDLVALGLAGQLLIYANTGFKSVLFSIALIPLVYLAVTVAPRAFGLFAIAAAPAILVGGVLADSLSGGWSLGLVRRLLATPGQVAWYFYDYFDAHPKYHLSHSFLGWLTSANYVDDPPGLIGHVYFPESNPSANAHLWADAFANFGFAGVVAFSAVLGVFLLVADGLARGRDARVFGPMLAIAGVSLASSALFTTLLTLGLGLGCVLMALMPPAAGTDARAGPSR